MYELVLLQVLAAPGDVSGHVEEVHHGQAGRVVLLNTGGQHTGHSIDTESVCVSVSVSVSVSVGGYWVDNPKS